MSVDNNIQYIPPTPITNWKAVADRKAEALRLYQEALRGMAPLGQGPVPTSNIALAVGNELRMDIPNYYGARGLPLKVLSLGASATTIVSIMTHGSYTCVDGGGVRGISALYILKKIMENTPGAAGKKPCEYFDVMAGTSTGGYVASLEAKPSQR